MNKNKMMVRCPKYVPSLCGECLHGKLHKPVVNEGSTLCNEESSLCIRPKGDRPHKAMCVPVLESGEKKRV